MAARHHRHVHHVGAQKFEIIRWHRCACYRIIPFSVHFVKHFSFWRSWSARAMNPQVQKVLAHLGRVHGKLGYATNKHGSIRLIGIICAPLVIMFGQFWPVRQQSIHRRLSYTMSKRSKRGFYVYCPRRCPYLVPHELNWKCSRRRYTNHCYLHSQTTQDSHWSIFHCICHWSCWVSAKIHWNMETPAIWKIGCFIFRCRHVSECVDADLNGKQSVVPITGLQRIINVSHIICNYDLPARIYVSRDSVAANVHELCWATSARTNAVCDWHTGILSYV